jgi:hypothetical protein
VMPLYSNTETFVSWLPACGLLSACPLVPMCHIDTLEDRMMWDRGLVFTAYCNLVL